MVANNVALVGTRTDHPLVECKRLLSRIAKALCGAAANRCHAISALMPVILRHFPLRDIRTHIFGCQPSTDTSTPSLLRVLCVEFLVWHSNLTAVEGASFSHRVKQDDIVLAWKPAQRIARSRIAPNDLVPEVPPLEYCVHDGFEIVAGRGVTVEVDRARRLEYATHGEEPDGHEAHESSHAVGVRVAGRLDGLHELGMIVGDLVGPFLVNVTLPRPAVLKPGPGRQRVRRRVEVTAFVERRIGRDQIHRFRVHGPEEAQIVAVEQRPIAPVGGHRRTPFGRPLLAVRSKYRSRLPSMPATIPAIRSAVQSAPCCAMWPGRACYCGAAKRIPKSGGGGGPSG